MGLQMVRYSHAGVFQGLRKGRVVEYYSYVNIFEQKGAAYILLLSFLVLAILFIRYLTVPEKKNPNAEKGGSPSAKKKSFIAD